MGPGLLAKGLALLHLCLRVTAASNGSTPLYKNPNAPVEDRVNDLLDRMTIHDKTAQLLQGTISFSR